ncbi:predicted protein [Sparassis crispa]|uniref:rRNA methyltransferase 2, mitochondrial n=1 Tax=Sparassis crispa TaxID=139825 RepID=A0A401GU26_9APHY|nr:predicted protein [Sparassis crispa]GBE85683.1 predicted protein [Sparassis crispa]
MSLSATRPLLSSSSRQWLSRQARDPYVRERLNHPDKFRARSAFKLLEIDQKFNLFTPAVRTVVDLGAAPGGWSQVVAGKLGWTQDVVVVPRKARGKGKAVDRSDGLRKFDRRSSPVPEVDEDFIDPLRDTGLDLEQSVLRPAGRGTILAVDLLPIQPIPGVKTVRMDFLSEEARAHIGSLLQHEAGSGGKADLILSDMAANKTGNDVADSGSGVIISQVVLTFAESHLRVKKSSEKSGGGTLVLKYFDDPAHKEMRDTVLSRYFQTVVSHKPPASRSESSERYWICTGFRGSP